MLLLKIKGPCTLGSLSTRLTSDALLQLCCFDAKTCSVRFSDANSFDIFLCTRHNNKSLTIGSLIMETGGSSAWHHFFAYELSTENVEV